MGLVLALALVAFGAAHVALVVGLAMRQPRWRALLSLVLPPLAAWWGWRGGMRRRAIAWAGALTAYAVAVVVAAASSP